MIYRRMQPRVTVVLATVWLTVAVLVGEAVTLRLSHDQYSPVSPRRHARVQRDRTGVWKDHDPVEDQPLDLWIGSRRSISTEESGALSHDAKYTERDFQLEGLLKDIVSSKRMYPFSGWQRRLPNIAGAEFAADKVDYGYEMPETLSREAKVSPSDLLDDPFVADDTFQDQGPGSMEIYKLDLSKEKTLLTATTPSTNLLSRNKSKAPKKTGHLNSKTKTTEIKSITSNHKQSNFFEEQRTETPLINKDAFDVGGVPELQVGCEGLEASLLSHKTKRSIDTPDKEKGEVPAPSVLLNVSPVSLDLDDVLSYDEEEYEEMDELLKLKRLETTTKRNKPNRGDMDASHLNSDHLDEFRRLEKLPERGDLGGSIPINSSELITRQKTKRSLTDLKIKNYEEVKPKRETILLDGDNGASRNHGRQLLWLAEANTKGFADGRSERKRTRRSIDWGFGEDEGVVSSDELQTVNERRRQHEMRYHQDTSRRRDQHHGLNTDIDSVRQEYEKLLEQKRREEEYLRQMQQASTNQTLPNRREEEEKKKRDELRRRQYEEYRERMDITTRRTDNEDMRRQMEERQKQEAAQMQETIRRNEEELRRREEEERRLQKEEIKRRPQSKWQEENLKKPGSKTFIKDDERKRRLYDEEMKRREEELRKRLEEEQTRRQEQYRSQQEAQRKREEEARRRQDSMRNLSENDKRRLEDRRREWLEKKRQEDENERRRQQPSNLMHAEHSVSHPNDIRQHDRDEKKRQQEERQREQKLREYITRNRPINVNHADQRSKEEKRRYRPEEHQDPRMNVSRNDEEYHRRLEEQRKRQEEERKLQDYIRRNQPVNVPSRDNQSTTAARNWFEERRLIEEARRRDRYPDPGVRRGHGPSAPTYIDPRSSPEEVRRTQQETARRLEEERRQRYEAEERRKELARRQWEEEEERRLRQQRMREEAARREDEARREQSRRYKENRQQSLLEIARMRAEKERRRQEMLKQRSRNEIGRTKQPETRPIYHQDPRLLAEHRRRQDSRPNPSNLMRAEEARRATAERERQRLEAERRQQEESRMREHRRKETDQWRRQELARLNSLPVSARIIVRPGGSSPTSPVSPPVISRGGFNNEIDFTGINPHREGVQVAQFPVPPTPRPPAQSPTPCVWAVVHCCSSNNNRLVKCFESLGCPGINWDPNPCRGSVADAARAEVLKFYANS
ncbi:PREDICTED: trichohyalin-like isoform X1 [Trachymyrmex septentrionalis]|uniref:trichohyalin-like isoform X1 n=2 Tax=Trachymyrmex septentrionalis TaxID=34720 RepID=UPI00084EF78E|nr:PREDICTED: trichohyalin-like isoform X1 [Trachymyrmex septentrionalis]